MFSAIYGSFSSILLLFIIINPCQSINLSTKSCIVFFTGGSNYMPITIYRDFLSHINSHHHIVKIQFKTSNKEYSNIIDDLDDKYDTITYLAHSSGATTALNMLSPHVDRLILLDPVATPNLRYSAINIEKHAILDKLKSLTIINADLSYKWSGAPPFIPFIPVLKLNHQLLDIDNKKISIITINGYGHSDLIDNPFRDLMHYSGISRGIKDRNEIKHYHKNMAKYIEYSIDNKKLK